VKRQLNKRENKRIKYIKFLLKKIDKKISFIKKEIEEINRILNNFQLDLRNTFKQRKKW